MPNTTQGRRQVDLRGVEEALKTHKVSLSETVAKAMKTIQNLADKVEAGVEDVTPLDEKRLLFAKRIIDTCGLLLQRNPSLGARNARQLGNEALVARRTNLVDEPETTPGGYHRAPEPPRSEDDD